jgi:RHS repeat-associated protein
LASTVGVKNPYRYRGYRFDTETGLYYLQSRFYNLELGRFINADDAGVLQATQGEVLGANLFAYCGNNPVMNIDPSGYFSVPSWTISAAIDAGIIWLAGALNASWMTLMAPLKFFAKQKALSVFQSIVVPQLKGIIGFVINVAANALIWVGKKALAASINIGVTQTLGVLVSNGPRFISACLSLGGLIAAIADTKSDGMFDGWIKLW